MATRKTTEQFITQAKKVHGNKYNYSKVEYVRTRDKVIIICPIHGEFMQIANSHIHNRGCIKCGYILVGQINGSNQEAFIKKSRRIHNDEYDYSKTIFKGGTKKITIICPIHGEFSTTAEIHLTGRKCYKCARITTKEKNIWDTNKFIEKAKITHGNNYDYSKSIYVDSYSKIIITCKKHGDFKQKAVSHIRGYGCEKCRNIKISEYNKKNPTGYRDSMWYEKSLNSNYFDSYKVYLMKFSNKIEVFYKIGKTYCNTNRRRNSIKTDYKIEIIKEIKNDNYKIICELERELHTINQHLKYIPKEKFGGCNECFQFTNEIIFEENTISIIT